MTKKRKFLVFITMLSMALFTCRMSAKTEIIAVHYGYIVLLKNPPLTETGVIRWWQSNRKYLKWRYDVPRDETDFTIALMNFADGYRIDRGTDEDSDLLCFEDKPGKTNCIEKHNLLTIMKSRNGMWLNSQRVKDN